MEISIYYTKYTNIDTKYFDSMVYELEQLKYAKKVRPGRTFTDQASNYQYTYFVHDYLPDIY